MKRRNLLKCFPGAMAAPVALFSAPANGGEQTAQERFDWHLAELKRAAEELDPMISHWHLAHPKCAGDYLTLTARRVTGRYTGDGIYESGQETVTGGRVHYRVELTDAVIDGARTFKVSCSGEHRLLLEYVLETRIGKRVGVLS
ncbi:hypothetical protein [Pelagibacterium luteolum]|uniref:Uncharacterized protein n=1 Tax=Pelagibacterium luteolum TaxID=440168 RepID=A0A1G7SAD1_9HYPH|nr:hypothetical protein [Pelagibacterium luteolum]SDG19140.1 hypothetical protein SAMN04487974_101356 [Pelagibacterium luteolum]